MTRQPPMKEQIEQLKADNRVMAEEVQRQAIRIAQLEQRERSLAAVLKNGLAIMEDDL